MPKRTAKQIAADNRERDAMLHTIEELSVWLQQLKIHLAHREEYVREWAVAKLLGRTLAILYARLKKDMAKDGYKPYSPHPQFPLQPYEFDKNDTPKRVRKAVLEVEAEVRKKRQENRKGSSKPKDNKSNNKSKDKKK